MLYVQLFFAFFKIGLFSFGGGYVAVPLIQNQIVEQYGWMDMGQFADLITIAEMTPGPIVVNCATFVGQQMGGLPGAVVCTLGSVLPSMIIVLFLSYIYMKYRNLKTMQGILKGLRPAIVAMIAMAGISLTSLALFDTSIEKISMQQFQIIEGGLFVLSLFLLRKYKMNVVMVIWGSGVLGVLSYLFT